MASASILSHSTLSQNGPISTGNQPDMAPPSNPPPPYSQEEVLSNRDILSVVFRNFLPSTSCALSSVERSFFLSLALQCRVFSEPALDCLWDRLDSLTPLVRVLPSAILIDVKFYLSGTALGLSPAFKKHASRVRSLYIGDRNWGENTTIGRQADLSVYVLLAQFLGGTPLLPGLKTLHNTSTAHAFRHALPLILPCPSLKRIHLGGQLLVDAMTLQLTIPLVVSRAASLRELVLHQTLSYPGTILSNLYPLRLLKTLIISGVGPVVSQHFLFDIGSNFRHLRTMMLDLVLYPIPLERSSRSRRGPGLH
ncbi:hypothetical protein NMY22_g4926 [Coprinellus aureogranulatus]|nr:hypothetical protein NMY22_g4926 [Coprinellus aureogranulatus]